MRPFDPATEPRACSDCKSEDVAETDEMRPSGVAPKILCVNGHVTNGMPTAAYFAERAAEADTFPMKFLRWLTRNWEDAAQFTLADLVGLRDQWRAEGEA